MGTGSGEDLDKIAPNNAEVNLVAMHKPTIEKEWQ